MAALLLSRSSAPMQSFHPTKATKKKLRIFVEPPPLLPLLPPRPSSPPFLPTIPPRLMTGHSLGCLFRCIRSTLPEHPEDDDVWRLELRALLIGRFIELAFIEENKRRRRRRRQGVGGRKGGKDVERNFLPLEHSLAASQQRAGGSGTGSGTGSASAMQTPLCASG